MQWLLPPLAHGALGWWDELIFLGVIIAFFIMMGISWVRSRNLDPDDSPDLTRSPSSRASQATAPPQPAPDRFELD